MDDSQYQHMCLMQTNNFYKYKPHSSFCKIFSCWLVVEFQNPAPEAGRLLKTAQILDRSKRAGVWALPRGLQETTAGQQQPSAGAVGGGGRRGGRVHGGEWEFRPWELPQALPKLRSQEEPSPNGNTLSGKSPLPAHEAL